MWNLWLPVANIFRQTINPLVPMFLGELEDEGPIVDITCQPLSVSLEKGNFHSSFDTLNLKESNKSKDSSKKRDRCEYGALSCVLFALDLLKGGWNKKYSRYSHYIPPIMVLSTGEFHPMGSFFRQKNHQKTNPQVGEKFGAPTIEKLTGSN